MTPRPRPRASRCCARWSRARTPLRPRGRASYLPAPMPTRTSLLDERALARTLARMATEIVERGRGTEKLVLVGIQRRGVELAGRLRRLIEDAEGSSRRARQARHHPLPRRPPDHRPPPGGRRDQPPRPRRQDGRDRGRRALHRPDRPRRARRVRRLRPAPADPALRADRPGRPRAAHPGRHRRHHASAPGRRTGWTCWSPSSTAGTRSSWCGAGR